MVHGARAACRSGYGQKNTVLNVENGAAVYRKTKEEYVERLLEERK